MWGSLPGLTMRSTAVPAIWSRETRTEDRGVDATKATYDLETQLEIAGQEGVFATKNGVRNMKRWDTEIPVLRATYPDLQILTCHDEYLLHTMFDVDVALVGYGGLAPEPLVELIAAGKAKDYAAARAIHDRLLPVT
jgi:4-hydroxy-tetrahydrodipicolinate synthase